MKHPNWRELLTIADKAFVKFGALLGVLSASILFVRSEILRPSPPDLEVRFHLSADQKLNYAQAKLDPKVDETEPVPVGLSVTNKGDATAKSATLTFIPDGTMKCEARDPQAQTLHVATDAGFKQHQVIQLGDLHPGQAKVLPASIWCAVLNISRYRMLLQYKDGKTHQVPIEETQITYDLEVRLHAESVAPKVARLYLNTSLAQRFEGKAPYYEFDGQALTFHPQVKPQPPQPNASQASKVPPNTSLK